jgi:hypothetical protein
MTLAYSDLPDTPEEQAKEVVLRYIDKENAGNSRLDVRLLTFTSILDEWTALLIDTRHTRYEVTCDTRSDQIRMNVFRLHENVVIDI